MERIILKMNIFEIMKERYDNREDKGNILPFGITDAEFRDFCIQYLLDDNWFVDTHMGTDQINECALFEILFLHSKKYRKEYKRVRKMRKRNKNY